MTVAPVMNWSLTFRNTTACSPVTVNDPAASLMLKPVTSTPTISIGESGCAMTVTLLVIGAPPVISGAPPEGESRKTHPEPRSWANADPANKAAATVTARATAFIV
jgi:hypothetical protein